MAHFEAEGAQNTIAVRYTRPIKSVPGAFDEVANANIETFVKPGRQCVRLTCPLTGWEGEQTLEIEGSNLQAYIAAAAEFKASPAAVVHNARVASHLAGDGADEVWRLL